MYDCLWTCVSERGRDRRRMCFCETLPCYARLTYKLLWTLRFSEKECSPESVTGDHLDTSAAIKLPTLSTPSVLAIGIRVLIVEDHLANRILLEAMVNKRSNQDICYEIEIVENGLEAVQIARSRSYNIILMDCNMPVMDGWQVVILRETETRRVHKYVHIRVSMSASSHACMVVSVRICLQTHVAHCSPCACVQIWYWSLTGNGENKAHGWSEQKNANNCSNSKCDEGGSREMHRLGSCLFACLFMCLNVLLWVCVLIFVSVYVCVVSLSLSLSLSL